MKKLALTALAAMVATAGLFSPATAGSHYGDDEWPRHGDRDGDRNRGDWDGRRDRNHDARRDRDRDGDDEWRHGHRQDHWRHHHRPRFVHRHHDRDYCFVKKVRRYDDWGNMYIKRILICR